MLYSTILFNETDGKGGCGYTCVDALHWVKDIVNNNEAGDGQGRRVDTKELRAKQFACWGKGYYTWPARACLGEIQKERNHDLEMWSKMEDERGSGRGGEGDFCSKLF